MPSDFISNLYVFILAGFVGFELIKRVSPLLHTPLMSLTNALDAIVVVGGDHYLPGGMRRRLSTDSGSDCVVARPSATWSADSSSPTACCACSRPASPKNHERHRDPAASSNPSYMIATRSVYSGAQVAELADDGSARRAGRRNRRGAGRRRRRSAIPESSNTSGSSSRWSSARRSASRLAWCT